MYVLIAALAAAAAFVAWEWATHLDRRSVVGRARRWRPEDYRLGRATACAIIIALAAATLLQIGLLRSLGP